MYLSHLTDSLDTLDQIVRTGLAFFPNKRKVFEDFSVAGGRTMLEEPLCRGMISFTDTPIEQGEAHRGRYGRYGIALNREWAIKKGACKVLYVPKSGPVFQAFSNLFGMLEPPQWDVGNPHETAWVNKIMRTQPAFAQSAGSPAYAELLNLHVYMQTDMHAAESEWRIMQTFPFTWDDRTAFREARRKVLWLVENGIVPTLRFDPAAVEFLICPASREAEVRGRFTGWRIRTHDDPIG